MKFLIKILLLNLYDVAIIYSIKKLHFVMSCSSNGTLKLFKHFNECFIDEIQPLQNSSL